MNTITIHRLDEKTTFRLRVRAARHGCSMEEEAKEILRSTLEPTASEKENLAETIHRRFAKFGGAQLGLPKRDAARGADLLE